MLSLSKDRLLSLFRTMVLIRRCEELLARSHQRGLVHGACHTYVGEEAIAAGVCAHLRTEDAVFSTHRGHGHALAKGVPPEQLIAELYGRATGCSRGRGGSMHLFAPEVGLMGTSGIVGPSILQAAGAGYTARLLETGNVGVAFFGDGAVNNGAFHEGLNLASIWKLPVLFVCENNQYATEVPFDYAAGNPSVANRAANYGMPGIELDGNDVLAIHAEAGAAIQRARQGGGPTLLECRTYRTRAHAEGMGDFTYRTREEVEQWKTRCPIARLKKHLFEERFSSEESSRRHIVLSQGYALTTDSKELPSLITKDLPSFLLSREVFAELKDNGNAEFTFEWSNEVSAISVKAVRQSAVIVDGVSIAVRALHCVGSLHECEILVIDDRSWPIILNHEEQGGCYWKLLEVI